MKSETNKATEIEAHRIRCRDAARRVGAAGMDPRTMDADYSALRAELESAERALADLVAS